MKWGVSDEFINQDKSTELCLNEIKQCQENSIGPSFVVSFTLNMENFFKFLYCSGSFGQSLRSENL
jgi:hypothetical protein